MLSRRSTKLVQGALCAGLAASLAVPLAVYSADDADAQARIFYRDLNGQTFEMRTDSSGAQAFAARYERRPAGTNALSGLPDAGHADIKQAMRKDLPPRPRGSDARICATQTEDLAPYRINSCTSIIGTGKLKGEALGVAYALRGLAYLDRHDIAHAIGDLNRAVDLAPDFAPAYQNRGNAWYARGNFGQAIADYDKAIALDPSSASPYINRAAVKRDLGYNDGALADYEKAIALRPNHANAYSGRGQLYMRQNNYGRALEDFSNAARLAPEADTFMLRAQAREASNDLDGAIRDYEESFRRNPKSVTALTAEAAVWRKKGDLARTIAVLDRALALDDNESLVLRMRAEAWRDKGDRKRAYADIGKALKSQWTVNGLRVRGNLKLDDGDADGALKDAEFMLKIEPDNTDAAALRGLAYAKKKDYAKALPDLDKAVAADAGNALAFAERGRIYASKANNDQALADFNRAIELKVSNPAIYRARAEIHRSKGNRAKALADLDQAIALDGKPAAPYLERAAVRAENGDAAGALADYGIVIAREPTNFQAYYERGTIHLAARDRDRAMADFRKAVSLNRRMTGAQQALAALEGDIRREQEAAARDAEARKREAENARREAAEAARREAELKKPGKGNKLSEKAASKHDRIAVATPPKDPRGNDEDVTASTPARKQRGEHAAPAKKTEKKREAKRETARERKIREYLERQEARLEAERERRLRAARIARQQSAPPPRALSEREKRELYFRQMEARKRGAKFTDIWR